jgi:outer membrane lipoprotein-sorting protein
MRWMVMMLVVMAQDMGRAEDTFHSLEKNLLNAPALEVVMNGEMKSVEGGATVKGSVKLATGNKARLQIITELPGQPALTLLLVSDGKNMSVVESKVKTPKTLNASLRRAMHRAGLLGAAMVFSNPGQKLSNVDKTIIVSGYGFGKPEKIGGRKTQVIRYKLQLKGDLIDAGVWLDTETKMPLKRVLKYQKKKLEITENYQVRVDVKIDSRDFELPRFQKTSPPRAVKGK